MIKNHRSWESDKPIPNRRYSETSQETTDKLDFNQLRTLKSADNWEFRDARHLTKVATIIASNPTQQTTDNSKREAPPYFFLRAVVCFAIVNRKSQLFPKASVRFWQIQCNHNLKKNNHN